MASGIYVAMGAARTQDERLETLSNNLANARTPGFKQHRAVYRQVAQDVSKMGDPNQAMDMHHPVRFLPRDRVRGVLDERFTQWTQGPLEHTGNPLDLALEGEGFFVVQGPDGNPLYTRNGNFSQARDGALVTQQGLAVLDDQGQPVRLPQGAGQLHVSPEGEVQVGGQPAGKLGVVRFDDPQVLERVGESNFRSVDPNVQPVADPPGMVHQGYLEGSNVNPVYTMTLLIKTNRLFELNVRALQAYKAMDDSAVRDVGRTS